MRAHTMMYLFLCITLHIPLLGTRTTMFSKQDAHVVRNTFYLSHDNIMQIHNKRGSIHVKSGNVRAPKVESHIYGPQGFTEYINVAQSQESPYTVYTYLQDIPEEEQEQHAKKKSTPTLSEFTIDHYITLPSQSGISVTSDEIVSVTAYNINGYIGVSGNTIATYIYNAGSSVAVTGHKGDITVHTSRGYVDVHTNSGTVLLDTIYADVNASARGALTARNIHGNAFVTNQRGSMYLTDIQAVLNAQSRDTITAVQHTFSENTSMFLDTRSNVNLYLPHSVNAHVFAKTTKGIVTSDIPITIDPITTRLSKDIWKHMQKQVKGTFGSGGAYINIDATGGVHIYEITE